MKKQLLFSLFLVAAILMSPSNGAQAVVLSIPHADGETLTANPGSQAIRGYIYGNSYLVTMDAPVYTIVQPGAVNGSNYVKLRDVANAVDFGVEWDAAEPNAMRIYTNRHYDGTGVTTGAATESKVATPSKMDIYIDGVLVDAGDLKIYLIDNQNYFAIRDLAKLVNFGCIYVASANYVKLDPGVQYVPDVMTPTVPRVIVYEETSTTFPRTYGAPSGEVTDTPHTVSPLDPLAREDYWNTYASAEAKAAFDRQLAKTNKLCYNVDEVNAIIQTLIDLPKIRALEGEPYAPINYVPAHYFLQDRDKSASGLDNVLIGMHAPSLLDITANSSSGLVYFDGRLFDTQVALANATEVAPVLAKLEGKTTREQAELILHAICDKFKYGGKGSVPATAPDELAAMWSDGKLYSGICEDYEFAMRYWFNLAGISYFYVGTDDHAWGEIYLPEENKWVAVDATWADGDERYNTTGYFAKYAITDPDAHYKEVTGNTQPTFRDAYIVDREIMELGMKLRTK